MQVAQELPHIMVMKIKSQLMVVCFTHTPYIIRRWKESLDTNYLGMCTFKLLVNFVGIMKASNRKTSYRYLSF